MDDGLLACDKATALWCPYCRTRTPSFVKDSRATINGMIRRRRVCAVCNKRFTTLERTMMQTYGRLFVEVDADTDNWESTG